MPRARTVFHSLRVATGLSPGQWLALGQAAVWISLTRAALVVAPWRRVSAAFERSRPHSGPPDWDQARRVVWAVESIARRVLPARPCLTQALVARRLLRRQGVETDLKFGAAREAEGAFLAHAWLEYEGTVVIGRTRSQVPYIPFPRGV